MNQRIVLGVGTGRCGLLSLTKVLNDQPDVQASYEEPPFLPWKHADRQRCILGRFARLRRSRKAAVLGDVASFYLPYLEDALLAEPELRVVCMKRNREDVIKDFCQWLDERTPLPMNHWAKEPEPGWHHDPIRTRTFPQYDTRSREEGIGRYWDDCYGHAEQLMAKYPDQIRVFDMQEALNTDVGQRSLLDFVGIPTERQVLGVGTHIALRAAQPNPRQAWVSTASPLDPRRCVVLVPFIGSIVPQCERALQQLERRGYEVRRVSGYAAIDQGRNQMATDALIDGFEETLWIDSDVEFDPDSVETLRSHNLPIVCGIYPQKGKRELASHIMPGTQKIVFGKEGGLTELLYTGGGFLLVRREVYLKVQNQLQLPMCNERFNVPLIPFFHPSLHTIDDGHWYLAEDYAFCERARQCGYKVMADTSIRLSHIGTHSYSWEDAGIGRERYENFTLNFGDLK